MATNDTLTIGSKEIPVSRTSLKQSELNFYAENPRIYSLVVAATGELPSQDDIQDTLIKFDHVKQLVHSIKANGGLIDPLLVRDGDFVVIEGNSRLAAYRALAKQDPIKWGKVKCCLLPKNIDDDLVSALLGEYHIIGRKDWAPYEQAGYLWRRHTKHSVSTAKMAEEIGLSEKTIKFLIKVYDFMVTHGENNIQRWSYYNEYLKSQKIAKRRKEYPEMDAAIVKKIETCEIPKAEDVRDKLTKICVAGGKTLNKLINDSDSFEDCYNKAIHGGADNTLYNTMNKFRLRLAASGLKRDLMEMPENQRQKCIYEMKKIRSMIENILEPFH